MAKAIENKGRLSLFEYGWAVRYGIAPMMVALGLAIRSLLAPILTNETVYTYFVPSVLGLSLVQRARPRSRCNRPQCSCCDLPASRRSELDDDIDRQRCRLCRYWSGRFVGRRNVAPKPAPHDSNDPRCIGTRSSFAVNSGYSTGGNDCHRRARDHAIVQQRR